MKHGLTIFLGLVFCGAPAAWALDGVSVTGGVNVNASPAKADFFQVAVRDKIDVRWLESDVGALRPYWEVSLSHWNVEHRKNWVAAAGVAARYEFTAGDAGAPYLEYALGGALLSNLDVAENRRVGSSFQFAHRFEIGYRFGHAQENEVGVGYWHYSNGGIRKPNPGMDFVSMRYTRRF
mgnify:CR=1 FL=1